MKVNSIGIDWHRCRSQICHFTEICYKKRKKINISVLWMQFNDELILFLSKSFPEFIKDKWCDQFYSKRNTLRIVWFNFAEKDQMIQLFQLINSRMKKTHKNCLLVCWIWILFVLRNYKKTQLIINIGWNKISRIRKNKRGNGKSHCSSYSSSKAKTLNVFFMHQLRGRRHSFRFVVHLKLWVNIIFVVCNW